MAVSALLALVLTACDSTSHGELVIAPEEPFCHPWPSCTTWTSDTAIVVMAPLPAKATERVKSGHNVLADFELSVPGESVRVRLKSGGRYRLEYAGPEGSILIRAPGSPVTGIPTVAIGHQARASGVRVLEFRAGPNGDYEVVAGQIQDEVVRGRLTGM